jgi:hypothetical protein
MQHKDVPGSPIMHASMREVETGLFSAEYPTNPDPGAAGIERPQETHIGTDAESVKFWVEEVAVKQGFTQVVWDELPAQLMPHK